MNFSARLPNLLKNCDKRRCETHSLRQNGSSAPRNEPASPSTVSNGSSRVSPSSSSSIATELDQQGSDRAQPAQCVLMDNLVRGADIAAVGGEEKGMIQSRRRAGLLSWAHGSPQTILLVKKPGSQEATAKLREIATWLVSRGKRVLVEDVVRAKELPDLEGLNGRQAEVDLCCTLGGDGTVLHTASLFVDDEPLPPLVAFAMGTLGFLTPFDADSFRSALDYILSGERALSCTLRGRMKCELYWEGRRQRVTHVLNEIVVDRGSYPSMLQLECKIDGHWVTTIRADGIILATPSGSTAYSMSSGGPIVAPSVPALVLTPVAPHSLSFRPIVIPETAEVDIFLPATSKTHARVSFDGRRSMKLLRSSSVRASMAQFPWPMITTTALDVDWYEGISQKLLWNAHPQNC